MASQHWFRQWLGAWWHHAIAWTIARFIATCIILKRNSWVNLSLSIMCQQNFSLQSFTSIKANFLWHTLMATIKESPVLNCIGVNLIGIYWFQCWVRLQNEVVLISIIHYLTNWMSVLTVQHLDWLEWMEVIQVAATLCKICLADWQFNTACFLLNHFAFSIIRWRHHVT